MVRFGRSSFFVLSVIFTACVFVQILFAGLAVFMDVAYWRTHTIFVHLMEIVPLLMVVVSFMCRRPRVVFSYSLGIFALIFIMYLTANTASILPWLAAFHPVMGVIIAAISISAVKRSYRLMREDR